MVPCKNQVVLLTFCHDIDSSDVCVIGDNDPFVSKTEGTRRSGRLSLPLAKGTYLKEDVELLGPAVEKDPEYSHEVALDCVDEIVCGFCILVPALYEIIRGYVVGSIPALYEIIRGYVIC